ncbi:DUF1236 domain-containing protein [Afipia felis]|uniref:Protein of uncharacterized function (DUF1236) n=2 Tax=Afipia felis TaxID=1035 RepID=A0A380WC00_AFIFE|nr:DUF1236 domain-containing protein [Afipia felis]EKS28884.1 hypothetical protein HMPREF9697_01412 [Afipia felis ATCC 53690]SUU77592.1 Protein of uncharacterised function (DUF1236) [Afipia felis]SUU85657.1 Protein of uncharacterised function (DUF1236) [Afipia felis]
MKTKLLMSAAAVALLMAGGVASAQNPNAGAGGAAGTGASSGASGGASMGSGGSTSARGSAEGGGSGATESHGAPKGGMRAQENAPKGHPRSAQENKTGQSPSSHSATDNKGAAKNNNAANSEHERMSKNSASESKSGAESKTTGNAATAAKGAPPVEKRSQITSAIKQEKVTAVTNVNFNVSVGTRVPTSVHFYPIPERVVAIYPEWRGYEFILVGGRYVIIEPETHEIVYILS